MLESNDYMTCVEACRLYSSTYPDRPRLHPATVRSWANNPKHPVKAMKYRKQIAISRASFLKAIKNGWPKTAGARHPEHALAKAKAEAAEKVAAETAAKAETVADAGYTCYIDEDTTVKLVDVKRWIGAARLDSALRICVERIYSEMKHVRKPADEPLVKLGNGEYTVEYREEDV